MLLTVIHSVTNKRRETRRLIRRAKTSLIGIQTRGKLNGTRKNIERIAEYVIVMQLPYSMSLDRLDRIMSSIIEKYPAFENEAYFRHSEYICHTKAAAYALADCGFTFVRDMVWASYAII